MRSFEICGCERGTTLGLGLSACGSKLRVRGCVLLYLDLTWARMGRRTSETTSLSPIWAKTGRRILRPDSKQVGDSPSPTCLRRLMRSLLGNPVPRLVNYRAYFLGWHDGWDDEGNLARSRSSTLDLRVARKCETCGLNAPEDWLGGTECALCFSEH